jgi:8-oxo-dGTP pyrophosphatase MutT (NUDIX family)
MTTQIDQQAAKELLLADYNHFSELLLANEQSGETRVNWFIVIVSSATAGIVALVVEHAGQVAAYEAWLQKLDPDKVVAPPALTSNQVRVIIIGALVGLLMFGLVTLFRMMRRNKNTDDYKKALDTVREAFQDHFDERKVLHGYYPFGSPASDETNVRSKGVASKKVWSIGEQRGFGGLAFIVAAINSVLIGVLVAAIFYRVPANAKTLQTALIMALALMGASFVAMWFLIHAQEAKENKERDKQDVTHAGGVVFKEVNGSLKYLILTSRKAEKEEWVLPKGKIRRREGHAEAALREVREESGVIARIVCPLGRVRFKLKETDVRAKFYLMEKVFDGTAKELRTTKWLPYEDAHRELTYPESKEMLESAEAKRLSNKRVAGAAD